MRDGPQGVGITVGGPDNGEASRVTVADDVVNGGWQLPSFQYGIEVVGAAIAQVSNNLVTDNRCGGPGCGPDPMGEGQGTGILALEALPGTRITDNTVSGNDVGIYQVAADSCCAIAGNVLTDNRWFGIVIQDGDGSATGNTVTGGEVGIALVAQAVDTTAFLRDNRLRRTTVASVRELQCCGYTATATR
jgi:parallel beta-helix repeat protein